MIKYFSYLILALSILFCSGFLVTKPALAEVLASQTAEYSTSLNVWQAIQELGNNLNGSLGNFTFRVKTDSSNTNQFNFTAQNSWIYNKTINSAVAQGCVPANANPSDPLRGLGFNTTNVPTGFEDVTIDFSCRNFNFLPGNRYLILITNANRCTACIHFASAGYGSEPNDYFPGGGMRYAFDNASCNPLNYTWNSQTSNSGCNVLTSPKDDLYFILNNIPPPPPPSPPPSPSPLPSPTPQLTPLILIPGIGGSELKTAEEIHWSKPNGHGGTFTHTYPAGEKVWVNNIEAAKPGDDDYFDILRMQPDGITSEANLQLTGNLFDGAYKPAIDFFTSNGYELNKTFFVFPYDWRKDISLTAPLLDQKVQEVKQQTGTQKVDIVSHSMGGLVARNYIADPTRAQNVRKLFTLGTPHLGSTKFIHGLLYGNCLYLEIGPACLSIAPNQSKDVLQNMISGYELAPSEKYFDFYVGNSSYPFPFRDDNDIDDNGITGELNYGQIKSLLANLGHNTTLFNPAESFHNLDNGLVNTNGVTTYIIAGSGIATLGQIKEKNIIDLLSIKIPKKDEIMINGDETIPLYSASLNDSSRNLSLSGNAQIYYTKQKHGALVFSGPALNLVKNILNGNNQLPIGVSQAPFSLKGKQLSVHSPVDIHVYDSNNRHTGPTPDGNFETNIPDSSYDTLDDAKFIFLPDDGIYNIVFQSTGQGSFDFKIRDFENDLNTNTKIYKDIPLTLTTIGQATFDTTSPEPPIINLDQNGDNIVDLSFELTSQVSGSENFDQTAPNTEITLNGTTGNNNWFTSDITVSLNASDDSSGISKIEYTLDNGQTIQQYQQPFQLTSEGVHKLKVRSTDKAGNEELPKELEIKIDKTPPEAKIFIDPNSQNLVVQGIDANQVSIVNTPDLIYLITDQAGNTLKVEITNKDKQKQDQFSIYSLQYNNNLPIILESNRYKVSYSGKKELVNLKEQSFEVKDELKVRIRYDFKRGESTIITRENNHETIKEVKDGLVLLQVITNDGEVNYSY